MQPKNQEILTNLYQGVMKGKGTRAVKISEYLAKKAEEIMAEDSEKGALSDYINIALIEKISKDLESNKKQ